MSKRRNPASTEIVNPTLVDSTNYREKAKRLKKEHDTWEKKQTFEVIRPDSKTTIYRKVTEAKAKSKSEIHKGRI